MTVFFHYSLFGSANVYLVGNDESREALLVDPAAFTIDLLGFIEEKGYDITSVLVTHKHPHHVAGLATLLKIYNAQVYSSNADIDGVPCRVVHDGDTFTACGIDIRTISVPGHSADSVVFRLGKMLFTGDALYSGFIGRTMSQYSNSLLKDQLNQKILNQADDCIVLPGHGPPSSVGAERLFNVGFRQTKAEARKARYDFFV
ncbi:MAG: MBL fold metallo-hydrolase [Spirochaetales bacterium]|nr:MAG: MBL fold metallo-hydrolase [Spirochaetales bacterium]